MAPTTRLAAPLAGLVVLALAVVVFPALFVLGWVVLLVLASLVAADVVRLRRESAVSIERQLPDRVTRGAVALRYAVRNPTARALDVHVLDELPDDLGGDLEFQVHIGPGEIAQVERLVVATRRGLRALGPTYTLYRSPLGFFERRTARDEDAILGVLADARLTRGRTPDSLSLVSESGVKPRRRRGEGFEFESLRAFAQGDDPRAIDWRATARVGRVTVRQYQIERNHTLIVAVDTGRLMSTRIEGQSKLDHALGAALALTRAAHRAGDRFAFLGFDQTVRAWVPPLPARRALGSVLEATLPLETRSVEPSYATLTQVLRTRHAKRALVVLMTDFVEGATSPDLERHLAVLARRHCVLLVALRDAVLDEIRTPNPAVRGRALYRRLVLQDLEFERRVVLRRIERLGVHVLDLDPTRINAPILARYLEIREAGLL